MHILVLGVRGTFEKPFLVLDTGGQSFGININSWDDVDRYKIQMGDWFEYMYVQKIQWEAWTENNIEGVKEAIVDDIIFAGFDPKVKV